MILLSYKLIVTKCCWFLIRSTLWRVLCCVFHVLRDSCLHFAQLDHFLRVFTLKNVSVCLQTAAISYDYLTAFKHVEHGTDQYFELRSKVDTLLPLSLWLSHEMML